MDKFGSKEYKEGYVEYRPVEGTVLFLENTIPDFIAQQLTTGALKEFGLKKEHLRQHLAVGGKYKGYYIPEPLMKILEQAKADPPSHILSKGLLQAQTWWKQYQLLNPIRLVKYNLRNLTGDAEAMFVGNPKVFAKLPQAFKEVINWKLGRPSELMMEWLERGGQDTLLQAQEMNKIIESPNFKKYQRQLTSKWNPKLINRYWKTARAGTDMREAWMRFAAFIHYAEKAQKGQIDNYGGSFKDEVDALSDPLDQAFMLSNDLLGAYDRISQGGDFLKKYVFPFWSFQEINMDRTAMFFRNAMKDDKLMGAIGRKIGAKSAIAAIKVGKIGFKLIMLSGLMAMWNNWMYPDEERALPPDIRRRSHIILGVSDKDGTPQIYYFPRVGILGDLLEWGGADTLVNDMFDVLSGKRQAKDIAKEFTQWDGADIREKLRNNQFSDTIINKVVQGIGPQYKIPIETLLGTRMFPDIFKPSPYGTITQYVGEQLSLRPIADKLIGAPQKKDWAWDMVWGALTYKGDVARYGYITIQEKKDKFLRERGLKGSGFIRNENASYLYNIGLAWRYGDSEALAKFYSDYMIATAKKLQEHQTLEDIWDKMDPMYGIPEDWKPAFLANLEPEDYRNLSLAIKYYLEMRAGKQFMKEEK